MSHTDRLRVVLHGAIVLLAGLLCGLPTVVEASQEGVRFWHTAHEALIMMGIWMLAVSSVFPVLVLGRREARAVVWCFLAMGYGFMVALVLGGIIGMSPFGPGPGVIANIAFLGSVVGILGSVVGTALTLMGASAALRIPPADR